MKHKQLVVSIVVVVAATLSGLSGHTAFAALGGGASTTCTWTGTAGDNKFSTATNWSCDSGTAPADGVTLAFDLSKITADAALTNDLAVTVNDLKTIGTYPSTSSPHYYTISGSTMNISGLIDMRYYIKLDLPLKATGAIALAGASFGPNSVIDLGSDALSVVVSTAGNYAELPYKITGSGEIATSGQTFYPGMPSMKTGIVTAYDYTGWTGKLTLKDNSSGYMFPGGFSSGTAIEVQSGSSLTLCAFNGASIPNALTIGGKTQYAGALSLASGCMMFGSTGGTGATPTTVVPKASAIWAGPVTLTADTEVSGLGELTISGALSGSYKITAKAGDIAKVTIASSNNTSQTTNGTQASATLTQTYSGTKDEYLFASANQIAVLDGQRTAAEVRTGGILKGSGVFTQSLTVAEGGIIAPGNSPGCITSNTLTLAGVYQFDLGGTVPCTSYDQLKVLNAASADEAVTIKDTAVIQLSLYNNNKPKAGQVFTIIDQAGSKPVSGTFKGLVEGATFIQGGYTYKISYKGGDGNDVTLAVVNTPKAPNTGFALLQASPMTTGIATALAVGMLLLIGRKLQAVRK